MKFIRAAILLPLAGFLSLLGAGAAAAQGAVFPQTVCANCVLGRLGGTTAGPAQAIPFTRLGLVPTTAPVLGLINSVSGSIGLAGITSGKVTVTVQPAAGTWTLTLPNTPGTNGQALVTNGAGQTSWAAGAGTVNGGTAGQLAYYATTAAAISGNANLNMAGATLSIGQAGGGGQVNFVGATSGSTILQAAAVAGAGTLTLPVATDTLVARTSTDTLTNKTLTSPAINTPTIAGGTHTAITGLGIRDTSAAFDVTLAATSSAALSTGRTLTLDVGNVAHTLAFGTTANTITFPNVASDTVAMLVASQTISNKTISASTYNGNTWTAGTGTLTIGAGKTLTASNSLTFTGTDATSFAFPSTSDTVATLAASQTFTNKTLTSSTINGGTAQALTNFGIRSSGGGAFDMVINNTETLTAQRALTITVNNAARSLNISGDVVTAGAFTTAGAAITLTASGSTNVTLPTTGTLATINTSQTFSGTNVFSALTQFTDLKLSSGRIYPTADSTTAIQIAKADGTTGVLKVDTTNGRLGINKTAGAFDLDVNGAVNVGGRVTFATLDGASLQASPSTITDMTVNNSPSASNDYIPYYNAAAGQWRRGTVGSIAAGATAGVSSLNGLTGGLSVATSGASNVAASGATVTVATPDHFMPQNCTLSASVATNILTVALKDNAGADPSATSPCRIPFRSSTAATGSTTIDSVTAALSITTNAIGATLGSSNSTAFRFWVVAFDNGGTVVLSLYNASTASACTGIDEGTVQSSTAISGTATAAATFYTPNGTTLASKAIKILGYVEYNSTGLATAGTYATGPNFIQTLGPGGKRPCDSIKTIYASTTTGVSQTAASYATGLSQAITPASAANLVKASATGRVGVSASTNPAYVTLFRSSTQLQSLIFVNLGAGTVVAGSANLALDKPNSASSTTYSIQLESDGTRAVTWGASGDGGQFGTMVLEEIMG